MIKRISPEMYAFQKSDFVFPAITLVFGVLFAPEWIAFFDLWYNSIIYSHGFLVLGISLYLLWLQWPELKTWVLTPSLLGFAALAFCSFLLLYAKAADIKTITLLALPVVIVSWGWALWGIRFVRTCGVPILVLVYAAPIWDDFSPLFQEITVFANHILLSVVHIPAEIRELYITIPSGTFFVAGGCSGVRYLMVALCLGTVYGNLFYSSARRTILLTVIAGALSMVANWIRVFGVIVAGHVTEMQSSLVKDHEVFGWVVFFIVTLIPLLFIARKLENTPPASSTKTEPDSKPTLATARSGSSMATTSVLASLLILLSIPVIFYSQTQLFVKSDSSIVPGLPEAPANWSGPLRFADFWKPDFHNEDINLSGVYVSQSLQRVQFQIVGYVTQEQGKELVYYSNRLYNSKQWSLVSNQTIQTDKNQLGVGEVKESILENRNSGARIVIWSWYYLNGYQSPSILKVKLIGGVHALLGDESGALLAVAAHCDAAEGCASQRDNMQDFLKAITLK
jgi:exosortase A